MYIYKYCYKITICMYESVPLIVKIECAKDDVHIIITYVASYLPYNR